MALENKDGHYTGNVVFDVRLFSKVFDSGENIGQHPTNSHGYGERQARDGAFVGN